MCDVEGAAFKCLWFAGSSAHLERELCLLSAVENFGCQLTGIPGVLSHEVVLN